jgi:hypothetical protein
MPLFSKPDTARATCVQPYNRYDPKYARPFTVIQENLRGYLDFMYTKLYTLHCSKTSGPNYKTSLSRCSAVPRSKSRHASAPWFLVDLARALHRRQYKMQVPWLHAYMNMPVSSEENLQQTHARVNGSYVLFITIEDLHAACRRSPQTCP